MLWLLTLLRVFRMAIGEVGGGGLGVLPILLLRRFVGDTFSPVVERVRLVPSAFIDGVRLRTPTGSGVPPLRLELDVELSSAANSPLEGLLVPLGASP